MEQWCTGLAGGVLFEMNTPLLGCGLPAMMDLDKDRRRASFLPSAIFKTPSSKSGDFGIVLEVNLTQGSQTQTGIS